MSFAEILAPGTTFEDQFFSLVQLHRKVRENGVTGVLKATGTVSC